MSGDGRRPHRFPPGAPAEVLAWVCAACGEVIPEFGRAEPTDCPVDWRAA